MVAVSEKMYASLGWGTLSKALVLPIPPAGRMGILMKAWMREICNTFFCFQ